MWRIEEARKLSDLERYRDEWSNLLIKSATSDFFSTYEWVTSWIESFWKDKDLLFLFVWKENELVAVAPFLNDIHGDLSCPHTLVTPINGESKRTSIIVSEDAANIIDCILKYLKKKRKLIRINLKKVQMGLPSIEVLLKSAKAHRLVTRVVDKASSPILRIAESWTSYLNSRPRHFRHELKRKLRLIENSASVEWVIVQAKNQVDTALENFLTIERNSWKHQEGKSIAARPALEHFYRNFASQCAQNGWLRMHLLFLNSMPVAYIYGLVFNNEYFALKTSFDEGYKHFSPGTVLFGYALRDSFEQKYLTFDFLGEESYWKNQFANDARRHADICLFSLHDLGCWRCKLYHQNSKSFIRNKLPFVLRARKKFKYFLGKTK